MSEENNYTRFTAADIEKYHKGLLSPSERHALEKAALDDPFFADALEGYTTPGVNIDSDLEELRTRLEQKTERAKVIPLHAERTKPFPWLRIAVLLVIIAGAGLLSYQFLFKSNNDAIAKNGKAAAVPSNKNNTDSNTGVFKDSPINQQDGSISSGEVSSNGTLNIEVPEKVQSAKDKNGFVVPAHDSVATYYNYNSEVTAQAPPKEKEGVEQKSERKNEAQAPEQREVAAVAKPDAVFNDYKAKETNKNVVAADKEVTVQANGVLNKQQNMDRKLSENYKPSNVFHGNVTDANNNPLPFANITNTRDNVGTYTDARGNFTLISPYDSVLTVQVKVLGFENTNVQLRNTAENNQVMMKEDKSLNAWVLDTVKRNISRARNTDMKFEEPEPADGWPYYSSYVANNLNVPDNLETKKSGGGEVTISFEVNKYGDPVNIKVEKSLCDACDKEAVRLIKEGPKWKRKAKKGRRTTVTVPFYQ